jgi:hypothetical protein
MAHLPTQARALTLDNITDQDVDAILERNINAAMELHRSLNIDEDLKRMEAEDRQDEEEQAVYLRWVAFTERRIEELTRDPSKESRVRRAHSDNNPYYAVGPALLLDRRIYPTTTQTFARRSIGLTFTSSASFNAPTSLRTSSLTQEEDFGWIDVGESDDSDDEMTDADQNQEVVMLDSATHGILVRSRANNGWSTTRGLNTDTARALDKMASHWRDTDKHKKEYRRLARACVNKTPQGCVCCMLILDQRNDCSLNPKLVNKKACLRCYEAEPTGPCALLVLYKDFPTIGFLPLPASEREGKRWEELGYWWA